jgi:hypothetical protein
MVAVCETVSVELSNVGRDANRVEDGIGLGKLDLADMKNNALGGKHIARQHPVGPHLGKKVHDSRELAVEANFARDRGIRQTIEINCGQDVGGDFGEGITDAQIDVVADGHEETIGNSERKPTKSQLRTDRFSQPIKLR